MTEAIPSMTGARTVVLGVGSPLMADDGLGVSVVETVRSRWGPDPDVAFLDGGTWGMQILPWIEEADRLLIIDAIKAGGPAGSLVRLEDGEIPRHLHQKLSPHQIDLGEVLALAQLRGTFPGEAVALGIEPALIELQEGFSEVVAETVPALVDAVEAQLASWGHTPVSPEAGGGWSDVHAPVPGEGQDGWSEVPTPAGVGAADAARAGGAEPDTGAGADA